MSVQNPERVVTKQDLKDFYDEIYPYLGGGSGGGGGDDANAYHTTDSTETTLADGDYFPFYDTSASGKRKSTWSNIKSTLKTYFDNLYATAITIGAGLKQSGSTLSIKPIVSGDMDEIIPELPSVGAKYHKYSAEEQVVGEWVDGKVLYERTLSITTPSSTGWQTVWTYASDISKIVNYFGTTASGIYLNYYTSSSAFLNTFCDNSARTIKQTKASGLSSESAYLTIQYTKTT